MQILAQHLPPTRLAVALASALTLASPAGHAAVSVIGPTWLVPGNPQPLGPGDIDLPDAWLVIGAGAPGSFSATAGSLVRVGGLALAAAGGSAIGLLDGTGTRLELAGGPTMQRLDIGHFGSASLTVSGGAVVDGRANSAACLSNDGWCDSYVGSTAGSTGLLTVSGAGSSVSLMRTLNVGVVYADYGFGTPGGETHGTVMLDSGASLHTDRVALGNSYLGPASLGSERSFASAVVDGAGSTWLVRNISDGQASTFDMANGARATATLSVSNAALLKIEASAGRDYALNVGRGGDASLAVSGAGSVVLQGDADRGGFSVGDYGGTGRLSIESGASFSSTARWASVGANGGTGRFTVTGAGSTARLTGEASLQIGNGGTGQLEVLDGASFSAAQLGIGARQGSGVVTLDGAGSRLTLNAVNTHRLAVGDWGSGTLTVSGGAVLDATGNAAACVGHWCGSLIGRAAGSEARFTVTGAGSQASFIGSLDIGRIDLARPPLQSGSDGTPGGVTTARVEVLNGGVLNTERVGVGGWLQPSGLGTESSMSRLVVRGTGSVWNVLGSPLDQDEARIGDATSPNSFTDWTIDQGGRLNIAAQPGRTAGLALGQGGNSQMVVNGSGSRITMSGERIGVGVGTDSSFSGNATLTLSNGGALALDAVGDSWVNIGERGSTGLLRLVSGAQLSGAQRVTVGAGGLGALRVAGASLLQAGQIEVGRDGDSHGSVTITGTGTRVALGAVVNNQRLTVGNGDITVSSGALLSTRANESACAGDVWCATLIGNFAGANAGLTVSGANSKASFTGHFQAGIAGLATQAADGWTQGTPGGQTLASIRVLDGGVLQTDHVSLGLGTFSEGVTGDESAIVNVLVSGAGSRWEVSGGNNAAYFNTQVWNAKNSVVAINLNSGGQMLLAGPNGSGAIMNLSSLPGFTTLAITGSGSALDFAAATPNKAANFLNAARTSGAFVDIGVSQGGRISGVNYLSLGERGGIAALRLDGAGSQYLGAGDWASVRVGRNDGQGSLSVSGGAQMLLHSKAASLIVGINGGQGAAQLQGAGSLLSLKGIDDGSGTGTAQAYVGYNGGGSLNIKSGAQLRIESAAPAIAEQYWRGAGLTVGLGDGAVAQGHVNVTGTGSRIDVLGVNPFITVGESALGSGQMTISDGAAVRTTLMGIGDWGANGSVRIDNASLTLSEAWRSGTTIGASLAVGNGTGSVGTLALSNGARLDISNSGPERTNLSLGGLEFAPGGTGVLNVSGGSSVSVGGAGGGQFLVGATAGGVGIATISGGSSVSASYLGVGALYGADTGVGTLLVQDGSTVTAGSIEIGAKGFVGGTGTLIGNIINRGVFSPGNSPGTLVIDGSFINAAGGRLVLEVQDDGQGGFNTDHLIFSGGSPVDLSGLQVSFRFLGNTNPNAFQASGQFDVDTFFQQRSSAGIDSDLNHGLFQAVSFGASANAYTVQNFSFSADGGATFTATAAAVPEPGEWAMFLAGLGVLMFVARRRGRLD